MKNRILLVALAIAGALLAAPVSVQAQCSGVPAANTVCAGPTSGGSGFPGFRTLVGGDLPAGALPLTSGHIYVGNGSNVATDVAPGVGLGAGGGTISLQPSALATIGGVNAINAVSHQWIAFIDTLGLPHLSQPSFADLSSLIACSQMAALTGDVTSSAGACPTTIALNAVTNAKLAQGAPGSVKCVTASVLANFVDCGGPPAGFAVIKPAPGQAAGATNPWLVIDPYGDSTTISTSGTQCQGLEKFWAAVVTHRWSYMVLGADSTAAMTCNTPLVSPTMFSRKGYIDAAVIISFTAQGAATLVTIDSYENSWQAFRGQFVQHSGDTGIVVAVKPTNADAIGNIVADASYLEVRSISPASGGIGMSFDATNGEVLGNSDLILPDVNGGIVAVQLTNPTHGIAQNRLSCGYIHGQTTAVIQEGTSTTNQANLKDNDWFGCERLAGTSPAIVWDVFAVTSRHYGINISSDGGISAVGIKLESGACKNAFIGGDVSATTALTDVSSCAAGTGTIFIGVTGIPNNYLRQIIPLVSAGFNTLAQASTAFVTTVLSAGEGFVQAVTPTPGVFRNLTVVASAPASGQTITATWRKNGANTTLTCTITGPATTCSDTTHAVSYAASDTYDLQAVTSATTGNINFVNGGVEFDGP